MSRQAASGTDRQQADGRLPASFHRPAAVRNRLESEHEGRGESRQSVFIVLDRYTGVDPHTHLWKFKVEARGAKVFEAHPEREDVED